MDAGFVDKIKESVDVGSVFLALDEKFFTPEALMEWLVTIPITARTQIAYKALCSIISPNNQYLNDSYHFLTKKPGYLLMASSYNLDLYIPDKNIKDNNNPLFANIIEYIQYVRQDIGTQELIRLLNGCKNNRFDIIKESDLELCFNARVFPYINSLTSNEINRCLVNADWTTKFRYNENLPQLIIQRACRLQQEAPNYYVNIAYKSYRKVAIKLNKNKLLINLSREDLSMFDKLFPEIIDTKILNYTNLAYKIALLSNDMAGYVLGLPIQNMIPNDNQIQQAIQILINLGVEKYINTIKSYVPSTYNNALPFSDIQCNIKYANETDVVMENIDNYVPFDIVSYQYGDHVHRFTRVEFAKIIESKKNPWTNDWIPTTILSTISSRLKAAKELGLPPPRPLHEMLTRIEAGTLFEHDDIPNQFDKDNQMETSGDNQPINLFSGMPFGSDNINYGHMIFSRSIFFPPTQNSPSDY